MTRRLVVYSEENGVYLGSALGFGFWSKLDPVGQPCAITFASEEEAQQFVNLCCPWMPVRLVPVDIDDSCGDTRYASIAACVMAGLPEWNTGVNPLPPPLPPKEAMQ
jgi:hypothetical protein